RDNSRRQPPENMTDIDPLRPYHSPPDVQCPGAGGTHMTQVAFDPAAGRTGVAATDLERQLEEHRTELTGYAYRMLGSTFDAEDAVQETLVRAWKAIDRFEGRAALRSWL